LTGEAKGDCRVEPCSKLRSEFGRTRSAKKQRRLLHLIAASRAEAAAALGLEPEESGTDDVHNRMEELLHEVCDEAGLDSDDADDDEW
jgi:hypothetical protein